jgi:hypothetical protein
MEAEIEGRWDWEVAIDMPSRGAAIELQRALGREGRSVDRAWRFLTVGAPTEERAEELAAELRDRVPRDAKVWVQGNPDELPRRASFVLFGFWNPV